MSKILIIELEYEEETLYQQIVDWLSQILDCKPVTLTDDRKNTFIINPYNRTFLNMNGNLIYLTAKEFDLLYFLYSHKGQVFTKEQLYEKVWGYEDIADGKNLTSFIRKLRIKIEPDPSNPQYIMTVWGVGYKFSGEEKP